MYKFIGKLENSIFVLETGNVYFLMFNKNEIGVTKNKNMVFVHTNADFNDAVALILFDENQWEEIDASKARNF